VPDWILTIGYGAWMVSAGYTIFKKGLDRTQIADRFSRYVQFDSHSKRVAVALFLGLLIGLNSGVFGAGGGVLIMLVLMFVFDYHIHSAIGTSTIIMAITAGSATVGYMVRGNIDVNASLILSAGTILAGVTGARFANVASEKTLSRIVGGIFMILGVAMTILRFF